MKSALGNLLDLLGITTTPNGTSLGRRRQRSSRHVRKTTTTTMQASAIYALWLATVATCLPNKRAALMSCVENALGDDALQRIVQPADETYTDARLGEHIQ